MQQFSALGAAIEAAWRHHNYDEKVFPALAADALRRSGMQHLPGQGDVLRWLLSAAELPAQDDLGADFGEPPVTVYRGRRFYIQVLFWLDGSTSIHRHGFSGAFLVLAGSSIHARYSFAVRRRVSSRFLLGDLIFQQAELLEKGAVVEISNDLTHALFHLEPPAATVVVRTDAEEETGPQYSYFAPHVAVDPFYVEPVMVRQLQALHFLRRTAPGEYLALATEVLGRSDLHLAFDLLLQANRACDASAATSERPGVLPIGALVEAARRRHGEAVEPLLAVLHEDLRLRKLHRLRAAVQEPDQRFFLALLQTLPDRDSIDSLLQRRWPGCDPGERVTAWLRALSGVERIGLDFDDALTAALVSGLLTGAAPDALLSHLEKTFEPSEVRAATAAILHHAGRIQRTALAPLFRRRS